MRVLLAGICVLVVSGSSPAFAQEVHGGFKAGVNFANLDLGASDAPNVDIHTGAVFGGFVEWPVGARVSIQPEVLLANKGASIKDSDVTASVRLKFVEVPVLVSIEAARSRSTSLHVFGGPSFGFRTSAKVKAEAAGLSEEQDIKDQVEAFDFGIAFGAGITAGHFVADGRYTFGLTDLNKGVDIPGSVHNRVFTVLAGVRF
jgi:outer membrane protein with beta-barrel domain